MRFSSDGYSGPRSGAFTVKSLGGVQAQAMMEAIIPIQSTKLRLSYRFKMNDGCVAANSNLMWMSELTYPGAISDHDYVVRIETFGYPNGTPGTGPSSPSIK
jgi:hypothetical protein